ncbi:hypothetical protein NTE_00175 [Candidatus Nitrososphaera evergladensis SR1]|uniref:Uncharacterized protein n=2 Tax=Nitrososphaera TaxID=497726 RepID=A0A075MN81_9ARCH|nr:hypothetical protein NTE_00175 [Candidatus Nitrososphaera evergladensis SR1]
MSLARRMFLGIALASAVIIIMPTAVFSAAAENVDDNNKMTATMYIDGSSDCWKWVRYPHGFGEWQQFKTFSPCESYECHLPRYELDEVCHNVLGEKRMKATTG